MNILWGSLAAAAAILDWLALYFHWNKVNRVTKPAVIVFLLLLGWQLSAWQGPLIWFGLALLASLVGDVFLLLPARYFIAGLAAFLAAHLFFLVGFNQDASPLTGTSFIIAASVGIAAGMAMRNLLAALPRGSRERERRGVIVYLGVLTLMWLSATLTLTNPNWQGGPAYLAAAGAVLFTLSDLLLAYNRYVKKYARGQLVVRILYHLGQAGILAGALMRWL